MDRDAFEVGSAASSAVQTSEQAAAAVLRTEAIAATRGHRLHSIGVTWSDDADTEASLLLKSLTESRFRQRRAGSAARGDRSVGVGDRRGHRLRDHRGLRLEPDTVIALIVHIRDGAVQTAVNHAIDTEEGLIRWLSTVFTRADWQPEALVVVGSGGDSTSSCRSSRTPCRCRCSRPPRPSSRSRAARRWPRRKTSTSCSDDAHTSPRHGEQRPSRDRRRQLGAGRAAGHAGRRGADLRGVRVHRGQPATGAEEGHRPRPSRSPRPRRLPRRRPRSVTSSHRVVDPSAPMVEALPPPPPGGPAGRGGAAAGYSEPPASIPEAPVTRRRRAARRRLPPDAVAARFRRRKARRCRPTQLAPQVAPAPVERPGIMQPDQGPAARRQR